LGELAFLCRGKERFDQQNSLKMESVAQLKKWHYQKQFGSSSEVQFKLLAIEFQASGMHAERVRAENINGNAAACLCF
jgi:hypothetical protein